MIYLIVGAAGICGAILRYAIGLWVVHAGLHPIWATLPINLAGSLILGAFTAYGTVRNPGLHPWVKAGFGTGFIGAFTTFSTFSVELMRLLQNGRLLDAALYLLVSLTGGFLFVWVGWTLLDNSSRKPKKPEVEAYS